MGVALITPFTKEGEVDYATLEKLVQMHLALMLLSLQGLKMKEKIRLYIKPFART